MKKSLILLAGLLLTACKTTEYIPVPVTHTDTLYVATHQRDSIHVRDSIYIKEKGDTVWITRWRKEYIERQKHDTIYDVRSDSVPYPVPTPVEVPRQLTWWQQTRIHAGELLFALLIGGAAFAVCRLKRK